MWRIYTGVPDACMADEMPPHCHKVSTKMDEELVHLIEGGQIIKYWTDHYIIPEEAINMIDWPALERSRSNLSFMQRKWLTKWAAEKIPTGTEMEDRQAWKNAACPMKCGEEMEDPEHIITCRKTNPLWREL
eukprot:4764154-Ditylum_brightwellii.AAC.1